MSAWAAKRFWTNTSVEQTDTGFTVLLDTRPVKTPAKSAFTVPTRAMAEAIAAEWQAQEKDINPLTMPFTRSANAAIDKVATQHGEVADMIAAYGDSDLICYRATTPVELVARQNQAWDPLIAWSKDTLKAPLSAQAGVMHVPQDPASIARLSDLTHAHSPFQLAAFHDLVSLSGSLIIGFAATHGLHSADTLWDISRTDELWQREQWGADEDADALAATKRGAFLHALTFFNMATA